MPVTLARLKTGRTHVSFTWPNPEGGEPDEVNLWYSTSRYTPAQEAVFRDMKGGDEWPSEPLVEFLITFIDEWDVLDEDGAMWPIDKEHLGQLPVRFLGECMNSIRGDVRGGARASSPAG